MKATEGPWNVSSGTIVFSDLANLKIICNTAPCLYSGLGEKRIELGEAQANAALIAAAPDLLDALKTLYIEEKRDDDDPILRTARLKAKAAIRKAEGHDLPVTFFRR